MDGPVKKKLKTRINKHKINIVYKVLCVNFSLLFVLVHGLHPKTQALGACVDGCCPLLTPGTA